MWVFHDTNDLASELAVICIMKNLHPAGGGQRFTSGAGGIRTRVQTKHFQAFSMLSNTLFVGITRVVLLT